MQHQLEVSPVFRYLVQPRRPVQLRSTRRETRQNSTSRDGALQLFIIYFKIQLVLPRALQDFPALPTSLDVPIRLSGDHLVP